VKMPAWSNVLTAVVEGFLLSVRRMGFDREVARVGGGPSCRLMGKFCCCLRRSEKDGHV